GRNGERRAVTATARFLRRLCAHRRRTESLQFARRRRPRAGGRNNETNRESVECPTQPSTSLRASAAVTIMARPYSRLCGHVRRKCDLWDAAGRKCARSPAESFVIGSITPLSSDYGK